MKLSTPWSWRDQKGGKHAPIKPQEDVAGLLGIEKTSAGKHKRRFSLFSPRKDGILNIKSRHSRSKSAGSASTLITETTDENSYSTEDKFDLTCINPAYSDGSSTFHPMKPINVILFDSLPYEEADITETVSAEIEEGVIQEILSDDYGLSCIVEETSEETSDDTEQEAPEQNAAVEDEVNSQRINFQLIPVALIDALSRSAEWEEDQREQREQELIPKHEDANEGNIHGVMDEKRNTRRLPASVPEETFPEYDNNVGVPQMILMDADTFTLSGTVWTDLDSKSSGFYTFERALCPSGFGMSIRYPQYPQIKAIEEVPVQEHTSDDLTYSDSSGPSKEVTADVLAPKSHSTSVQSFLDCSSHSRLLLEDASLLGNSTRNGDIDTASEGKFSGNGVEECKGTDSVSYIKRSVSQTLSKDKNYSTHKEEIDPFKLWNQVVDTMTNEYSRAIEALTEMKNDNKFHDHRGVCEDENPFHSVFGFVASIFNENADPFPEQTQCPKNEDPIEESRFVEI